VTSSSYGRIESYLLSENVFCEENVSWASGACVSWESASWASDACVSWESVSWVSDACVSWESVSWARRI